jgi:PIN domain nuclease of toxin-antitoxin system
VRVLLDTQTFLWFLLEDPQLRTTASDLIIDPTNAIEVSPATYWEIAITISRGKYTLPEPYDVFMEREIATNDCRIVPIEPQHTAVLTTRPFPHRDPCDRRLLAQARVEALPLLRGDTVVDAYPVPRL